MMRRDDLSEMDPYYEGVLAARSLLDRREVLLYRMLFNLRVVVTCGQHSIYFEDGYCFHYNAAAWAAFESWNGEDPPAQPWAKNPYTGARGPCDCDNCERHRVDAEARGETW